jgi:hypothetical protein
MSKGEKFTGLSLKMLTVTLNLGLVFFNLVLEYCKDKGRK